MKKIMPHLWFDKEAGEAAEFYVAAFRGDSAVTSTTPISDTPSGNAEVVTFRLLGHEFMSISAGPLFRINPSISFVDLVLGQLRSVANGRTDGRPPGAARTRGTGVPQDEEVRYCGAQAGV
jgi:hypothetical protein